jgi:alanine racemase
MFEMDIRGEPVSGQLLIDLAAIQTNYRFLCSIAAPATVAAVVKADAYGLGAMAVSNLLCAVGCRAFVLAHLNEALAIVPYLSSVATLYVLNGLMPGEEAQCAALGIIPALNGVEEVENWARGARSQGGVLPAALQIDSGMSRPGLSLDEAAALASDRSLRDCLDLKWLMSDLRSADVPDSEENLHQLATFRDACALFPETPICFANSGCIFLGAGFRDTMVRSGIALYGGAPLSGTANPMTPVVSLTVPVVQTRHVSTGGKVGKPGTTLAVQTTDILDQIDALLAEAGSDKSHILSATLRLADISEFAEVNTIWEKWIDPKNPPARATGEVKLVTPDYKVEIIIVAALRA